MAKSKTSPSRRATRLAIILVLGLLTACAGSGEETTTTTVAAAITTTSGPGTTVSSTSTSGAGSSTSSTSDEEAIEIEIEDGQPQGGVRTIDVDQGDTVRFEVKSDAAYEIHVHGYDLMYDVEAGGRVQIEFEATVQGIFEIEIEDTSTQIAELVVS